MGAGRPSPSTVSLESGRSVVDGSRRSTARPPLAWRVVVAAVLGLLRRVFLWRVQVRRPATIPPPGQPLLVVLNHTSAIDAFLVADAVWRHLRHWSQPLVKAELFDIPVLGRLIVGPAGAVPVVRGEGSGRESAYGDAVERLREGGTVMILPEGTITHDGSLLPLRHGAARLALEAGVDVLVVTHFGAQRGFSPIVRKPERAVIVTMAMDLISPRADEDASALTGRIAATMMDRGQELRASYPVQRPDAPWWPPYSAPASPTATARENLERYRQSMAEAVANARERMAQVAEEHAVEERVAQARERAAAAAEGLATRSRERVGELTDHARDRVGEVAEHARERVEDLSEHTRERVEGFTEHTRDRVEELTAQARDRARRGGDGAHTEDRGAPGSDDGDDTDGVR